MTSGILALLASVAHVHIATSFISMTWDFGVIAEDGAVGVPLTHRGSISCNDLPVCMCTPSQDNNMKKGQDNLANGLAKIVLRHVSCEKASAKAHAQDSAKETMVILEVRTVNF